MRMHERVLQAIARGDDPIELASPAPGRFRKGVSVGDVIRPGTVLGELDVLGQLARVLAPDRARGVVTAVCEPGLASPPVDFGAMLVTVDPHAGVAASEAPTESAATAATGLVFRAPTSGRFYGRPSPDKPVFVSAGAELATGGTVCLLEVMKTFHRVTFGGGGLPDRVRVREVLVADGDDVNAGDPLLALDPA